MKIITGRFKGKMLKTLEGYDTRPTSERIKEAIFSSIQFDIDGREVLDLFAGSGQMGLEAMSRGARSVTFVDLSADAMTIVKTNAQTLGVFRDCRYLISDYRNYMRKAAERDAYDLVFVDPPYAMACCTEAVERLVSHRLLRNGALIVLECGGEEDVSPVTEGHAALEVLKDTRYGKKTHVVILRYRKESDRCV